MKTKLEEFGKRVRVRWPDILFSVGIGLIILGLAIMIVSLVLGNVSLSTVALGWTSLALACIAIAMAKKSDETMKAMVKVLFDQALSVLLDYSQGVQEWRNVFYSTRAALRLIPWANEPMKRDLKNRLVEAVRQAKSDGDTWLIERLEEVWRQYDIDKW